MANVVSSTIEGNPFFLQKETGASDPIYYSAADMRNVLNGIISRPGVLGASHMLVQQGDNVGMRIKINSGYCMVGGYLVYLPTDQTLDLGSFNGSPDATRSHAVYVTVHDGQVAATGTYAAKLEVIEDTGGGAGTPNAATASTKIATISVAKNQGNIQNKNITDLREHGGVISVKYFLATYLDPAYSAAGTDINTSNPYAMIGSGTVRLGGSIKRSYGVDSNTFSGNSVTFATLTLTLRPKRDRYLLGAMSGSAQCWRLQITTDGQMKFTIPAGAAPPYLILDGITYDID